jgi:hypothetical protein
MEKSWWCNLARPLLKERPEATTMNRLTSVTKCFSLVVGTALGFCTACSAPDPAAALRERDVAPRLVAATAALVQTAPAPATTPALVVSQPPPPSPLSRHGALKAQGAVSAVKLTRLVVTTAVKDREPAPDSEALVANGSAIYAFAELSNPAHASENVRITFERKGGAERVGNVTLPVPGQVARHRTWAFTRFIRAAGVWDAVLWSESGAELGRTSFEVSAS